VALSLRQAEALTAHREFTAQHHRPPSPRELGAMLGGITHQSADKLLLVLRLKGYVGNSHQATALDLLSETDGLLSSVRLTNGDRQRVQSLRGRIAELLGKPFAEGA
jgi:SOS-response transcriptional repressor LexA